MGQLFVAFSEYLNFSMNYCSISGKNVDARSSAFLRRPQKFGVIFNLIWHLLVKRQIKWKITPNFCDLLIKNELLKWKFSYIKNFAPRVSRSCVLRGFQNKIELDMFYDYEIKSQIKIYQNLSKSVKTCRIYLCRSQESSAKKNPYRLDISFLLKLPFYIPSIFFFNFWKQTVLWSYLS